MWNIEGEKVGRKSEITGKPSVLKELNSSLIKDALSRCGQATRVELAGMTKISQPTVNLLIRELLSDGTVVSLGAAQSTGGRRAEVYALNQKKSAVVLITVGDSSFETSVIDMNLEEEQHGRTARRKDMDCLMQMERILDDLIRENPNICAIAAGVPGAVSADGEVFAAPSVPGWENFPLKRILEDKFSLPVYVANDINASAAGYCFVHGGVRNMVYLFTDGDGIGAGIIVNGELYYGFGSFAGELGYMRLGGCSVEERMHRRGSEMKFPDMMAQIIVNIVCLLNPERIVLAGCEDMMQAVPEIRKECGRMLPDRVLPQIDAAGTENLYYLKGLGKLGCGLVNKDIHVV